MKLKPTIKTFINGPVSYDRSGQYFWVNDPKNGLQMLAELRGWGAIQNLFKSEKGAEQFQDEIGEFIAAAINEKIERVRQSNSQESTKQSSDHGAESVNPEKGASTFELKSANGNFVKRVLESTKRFQWIDIIEKNKPSLIATIFNGDVTIVDKIAIDKLPEFTEFAHKVYNQAKQDT